MGKVGKVLAAAVVGLTVVGYLGTRNPQYSIDSASAAAPEKKDSGMRDCRKTSATDVLSLANSSKAMLTHMAKATGVVDARAIALVNGTAVASYVPGELVICGVVITTTTYKRALLTFKRGSDNEGHDRLFILAGVNFPGDYPLLYPSNIPILQDPPPCHGNLEWGAARVCNDKEAGWILPDVVNANY